MIIVTTEVCMTSKTNICVWIGWREWGPELFVLCFSIDTTSHPEIKIEIEMYKTAKVLCFK